MRRLRVFVAASVILSTTAGCALPRQTPVTNVVMSNVFRNRDAADRKDHKPPRDESLYRKFVVKPMTKMTLALVLLPTTLKADCAIEKVNDRQAMRK